MGASYSNITVKGAARADVAKALGEHESLVSPLEQGCVIVFDSAEADGDDGTKDLAQQLSAALKCTALAVSVHDDDVMQYALFVGGELSDEYNSAPSYFSDDQKLAPPAGGKSDELVAAFGAGDPKAVEEVLRASKRGEGGYLFEAQRHAALAAALGIPDWVVGAGYEQIEGGWYPEGLTSRKLKRTGPKRARRKAADPKYKEFTEQIVRTLIEQGRVTTAFGEAARWGRMDLVKELLAKGAKVDELSEVGCTPVMLAACGGHLDLVKHLIDRGADVNAVGEDGRTALLACVCAAHTKKTYLAIAELLFKAGAALTIEAKFAGKTVLEWAKDGRPHELVELIERYSQQPH